MLRRCPLLLKKNSRSVSLRLHFSEPILFDVILRCVLQTPIPGRHPTYACCRLLLLSGPGVGDAIFFIKLLSTGLSWPFHKSTPPMTTRLSVASQLEEPQHRHWNKHITTCRKYGPFIEINVIGSEYWKWFRLYETNTRKCDFAAALTDLNGVHKTFSDVLTKGVCKD